MAKDRSPRRRPRTKARSPRIRRIPWRWLLPVVPIVLVAAGTYVAVRSPYLTVQSVQIEGTRSLDQASLIEISGLREQSMLQLPVNSARNRLQAIPEVRSVAIKREWPSSVVISIEERIPTAYWSVGGRDYLVDRDGVVLGGGAPEGPMPRIVEISADRVMGPGDRVHPDAIAFAHRIMAESPDFLGQSVELLEYRAGIGVTAVFRSGLRVTFGDDRSYDYKVAVLTELLNTLGARGVEPHAVDLRFGERVTYE